MWIDVEQCTDSTESRQLYADTRLQHVDGNRTHRRPSTAAASPTNYGTTQWIPSVSVTFTPTLTVRTHVCRCTTQSQYCGVAATREESHPAMGSSAMGSRERHNGLSGTPLCETLTSPEGRGHSTPSAAKPPPGLRRPGNQSAEALSPVSYSKPISEPLRNYLTATKAERQAAGKVQQSIRTGP
ncbi:hypothetical protein EYF80_024889 [Liparis tanakae]|uniref:Uncharacterized protein n=1 Tax=Liparis tanakae TaxID=230148 RepID=A0A4Z2HH16_9TELE|nr:hypothetical protein EYF80_024889 [Liparis tanakae]